MQAGRNQGHGQPSRLLPHVHCLPRTAHARLERARGARSLAVDVSEAETVGVNVAVRPLRKTHRMKAKAGSNGREYHCHHTASHCRRQHPTARQARALLLRLLWRSDGDGEGEGDVVKAEMDGWRGVRIRILEKEEED